MSLLRFSDFGIDILLDLKIEDSYFTEIAAAEVRALHRLTPCVLTVVWV